MYEFEFLSEYPDYAYSEEGEIDMENPSDGEVVQTQGLAQVNRQLGEIHNLNV